MMGNRLAGNVYRCQSGWKEYQGSCYLVSKIAQLNWFEARQWCVQKYADLASIRDPAENNFIVAEVAEKSVCI